MEGNQLKDQIQNKLGLKRQNQAIMDGVNKA